jgi:hypothetical protein
VVLSPRKLTFGRVVTIDLTPGSGGKDVSICRVESRVNCHVLLDHVSNHVLFTFLRKSFSFVTQQSKDLQRIADRGHNLVRTLLV